MVRLNIVGRLVWPVVISIAALAFSGFAIAEENVKEGHVVDGSAENARNISVPHPKLRTTIDMGADVYVVRLAFSPDSRYIAVGDGAFANIVIWDLLEE